MSPLPCRPSLGSALPPLPCAIFSSGNHSKKRRECVALPFEMPQHFVSFRTRIPTAVAPIISVSRPSFFWVPPAMRSIHAHKCQCIPGGTQQNDGLEPGLGGSLRPRDQRGVKHPPLWQVESSVRELVTPQLARAAEDACDLRPPGLRPTCARLCAPAFPLGQDS